MMPAVNCWLNEMFRESVKKKASTSYTNIYFMHLFARSTEF